LTYNQWFYDTIRPGVQASAAVVVPLVTNQLNPRTVVDVGCGEGWWARAFADVGCDVLGIDGPWMSGDRTHIPYYTHDLAKSVPNTIGRFDLAVSLEVAEHLPPGRAESFVTDLCRLADVVLFSAAIPGQGGAGHLNEQPAAYWAALFDANDYMVSGALRWMIWDNPKVENWYRQNLLVAVNTSRLPETTYPALFDTPTAPPWDVVHPVLFDARRPR